MSYFTKVSLSDSPDIDAFGHLRVSIPEALGAVIGQYDSDPLEMEAGNTGAGSVPTHDTNLRMSRLSATAGTGTSFLQSYVYWTYQPGRSQRIDMTGLFGAPVAGVTMDYGYFDTDNGLIYRQNGTSGLQFLVRSKTSGSVVNIAVNQADWNLDTLDGTGPSGIILDPTKVFLLTMDLEFLGMGRVRVGFNINGLILYVHEFVHTNVNSVPYMQTATLPIQILLTATASAGPAEMFFKGCLISSEGGLLKDLGFTFATPDATVVAANGARTHLMSVRPKLLFNGHVNRENYITRALSLVITGANPVFWELVAGANFSVAPTFVDVNTQFSGTQVGTGGTFSNLTGGVVLANGYATAASGPTAGQPVVNKELDIHHPLALNRAGANITIGTLSLLVTGLGGVSATRATLQFTELR
jgi:hypothetical protein